MRGIAEAGYKEIVLTGIHLSSYGVDFKDGTAQEQDCSDYCVAGPITDNRDGTLTVKMGQYTQLEKALQELEEALT